MNSWGRDKTPFLFAVDFEMEQPWILKVPDISPERILYDVRGQSNAGPASPLKTGDVSLRKFSIPLSVYAEKYKIVYDRLAYGDSYLTNLTIRTPVAPAMPLREIFYRSNAPYKLLCDHEFLVFSPETFVRISDGKVFAYPMKGTIDAAIPGAREKILQDPKELAEHVTIVDLIRNDLSQVSDHVHVPRFRYVEELHTNTKNLLQVSSEICGQLPPGYRSRLGEILVALLPAGSVSGAPKKKTVEIIRQAEAEKRGFYTGVFGFFNGTSLDSGVMIRFLQKDGEKYFYRSGGGITTQSVVTLEYQEAIDKVYVPVD
ncbi:MAG TPA: aminodeoxychorismate synthase component I [Ohtaekwangia sp.]|nr:aminodeoxychorismate synthase component I [Ohtaekwangia sp.]